MIATAIGAVPCARHRSEPPSAWSSRRLPAGPDSGPSSSEEHGRSPAVVPPARERGSGGERSTGPVLVLIAVVAFLAAVDSTIVAAAAGSVAAELHLGVGQVSWLGLGYVLPYAALLLPAGPMIDRLGERAVLRWGSALFGAGSWLAGFASTWSLLIAGRVLQGVAAAAVVPAALMLLRTALPPARRASGAAIWLVALAGALAAGPVLGGALSEYLHWRWVFWSVLPFVLIIMLLAGTLPARLGEVAPRLGGSVRVLLRRRGLRGGLLVQLLWGVGVTGVAFFTPVVHQELLRTGPSAAALPLLAVAIALIVATPLVGRAVVVMGAAAVVVCGLGLVAAGLVALAAVGDVPALGLRLAALAVIGFGSAFTAPLTTCALEIVPERLTGTAAGMLAASRELSGALGVALVGALMASGPMVAGYADALVVAAAVTAVAALLAARVLPRRRTSELSLVD
ncbi:MFS transporter [Saccharopolyspora indica]|uniref:MFS transporter n=1 Tax=Saccharopolyspora indica TaxID=1229659 RepID=UPI0022EA6979|nr:MFS transporter [Saccharopolyspora indica]MDA3644269.1 MFS transporter [Saccharopolyspora indica]